MRKKWQRLVEEDKEEKEEEEENFEVIKRNPKDPRNFWLHKYNPLSRLFFCWLDPLIFKGFRNPLSEDDLYTCPQEAGSKILLETFERYWMMEKRKSKPKMWLAIFKCFYWRFLIHAFVSVLLITAVVCQSLLLGLLSQYFTLKDITSTDTTNAYLYALGLTLLSLLLTVLNGMMGFIGYKLSMLVRIVASSAIYKKIVKLSPAKVNQLTVGHLLNLASNDVHRFDQSLIFYNYIWIAPFHLVIVTYLIYAEIGPSAFIGTALVITQVPLQHLFSQLFIKLRLKAAKLTDSRILIMNEIITGIRVIKMYGWEYAFHELVANIRSNEVQAILKSSIFRVISLSYYPLSIPTMMFAIFSVYVSLDDNNALTAKKVFTTLSLVTSIRLVSLNFFVKGVLQLSEGNVALKRISEFLLSTEKDEILYEPSLSDDRGKNKSGSVTLLKIRDFKRRSSGSNNSLLQSTIEEEDDHHDHYSGINEEPLVQGDIGVTVNGLSASWSMNQNDVHTLSNVSFKVDKSNPLLAVIGSVGAGKSTLLQCILNELPPISGSVTVKGSIAYVSQEPWIFSDTLRANVLFGLEYEQGWYNEVIEACALDKDIDQLIDGDLTLVGERGVTLSGGQKARINLARAVYRNADIYLLDDPLSAVDAAVCRHIFDKCIKRLLSESCIVLVTHQLQYLQQCDQILGLKEGCVTVYGDPTDILSRDIDILTLVGGHDNKEEKEKGMYALRRFSIDQNITSESKNKLALTVSIEKEEDNKSVSSTQSCDNHVTAADHIKTDQEVKIRPPEEKSQGTISMKTYYRYFIIGGGYVFTGIVFGMLIIAEFCIVGTDWWMADWSDCNKDTINSTISHCYLSDNSRIGIYFGLLSSVWISCLLRSILFYILSLRAARILHAKMFNSIIRAPILFFDTNTSGRILNRFSKDIGFLDDILIYLFCEYLQRLSRFVAIMITAIVANYYLSVMVFVLSIGFLLFRWYYLKTARDVKRIEALIVLKKCHHKVITVKTTVEPDNRSPLYSHISMTLQGLVTIRAYNMVNSMMNEFYKYQNKHTQAWYLYVASGRWFGMRIDFISSIFVAGVSFISIPLATNLNSGLVGLALTYAISLSGMFQYCVRLSTEVESYMVSTERVLSYSEDIQSEASLESNSLTQQLPTNWPQKGDIELNNVSYRHSEDSPLVLKEISIVIKSGEKVGIVGRTGAGKSSLVAALFRLAEPTGTIKIDGLITTSLGLHDIRTNISIIPQDPVLFTGTIHYNLDPFNAYTDNDIWIALEQVQLKLTVESLEKGLDSPVSEGGSNFSVGQRQLFCLARALLRNNKILIMDEATANVDLETDAIIQVVIREQFKECTVLTIAHRLDTVMDSDKIMVLRYGELIEYDSPHLLLSNPDSYLLKLVEHTGPQAASRLKEIALLAYNETLH